MCFLLYFDNLKYFPYIHTQERSEFYTQNQDDVILHFKLSENKKHLSSPT